MSSERSLHTPSHTPSRGRKLIVGLVLSGLLAVPLATGLPAGADEIDDKRAEAQQVAAELETLESNLMDLAARYERSRYELSKVEERVAEAEARVDDTQAQLEERQAELRDFAVQAYRGGNESPQLDAFFTSDGDTAPQRIAYIRATTGNRQDLLDGLRAAKEAAESETAELVEVQAEAEELTEEIASAQAEAEDAAEELRAASAAVEGELATLIAEEEARQAEAARIAEEQRQAEAAAAAAEAEEAEAAARTSASSSGTVAPSSRTGPAVTAPERSSGSTTAPSPSPPPSPSPEPVEPAPPRSGLEGAIQAALSKQGSSYVWAASGPNTFDCSGLLVWAFGQVGISLPHYSGAQYNMTTRVSRGSLQRGDLIFWGGGGSDHVALYLGGNQMVHAFPSGGGVRVTQLDGWWKTPSGYGRLR